MNWIFVMWVVGSFVSAAIHQDEGTVWIAPFWPIEISSVICAEIYNAVRAR